MAEQPVSSAPEEMADEAMQRIVGEEERVLRRVLGTLANRLQRRASNIDYDAELTALRDEIAEARLEDVPALVAQMERLQQVASRRHEVTVDHVDPRSPYFARLVLQEGERKREVLIGRGTYLDPRTGVQIVDWRDAPVSRIYYRYDEGDDYDEVFGGREVEGDVLVRRSLAIADGMLRRIVCPQGTFVRRGTDEGWRRLTGSATELKGGQGAAERPESYHRPGQLGVGVDGDGREEKYLPEIAALIDRRQFDLITQPESGLVVIQGGAGSGKTTIGLHRLAYLAFQQPKRFRGDRMLVVVFNDALARYISRVLPALGVSGVAVLTFQKWAARLRAQHVPQLPRRYTDDTPGAVVRLKKHPAMLRIIDDYVAGLEQRFEEALQGILAGAVGVDRVREVWRHSAGHPLGQRVTALSRWLGSEEGQKVAISVRHALERELRVAKRQSLDVVGAWSELLTDREALERALERHAPGDFAPREIGSVHRWCTARCSMVQAELEEIGELQAQAPTGSVKKRGKDRKPAHRPGTEGIDGVFEEDLAALDTEDDTLFLRLVQRMQAPLRRNKDSLRYEHVFVDEAQDLSPVELAVVMDTVHGESVTLAGDVAQRLLMDNGFTDWKGVLGDLGLSHVEVEPLKLGYRSTKPIMEVANSVLGSLPHTEAQAVREGVPVELFRFAHAGDAVGFLAEALRALAHAEPRASVAVIARYPEQAEVYYRGLANAEVPHLRHITEQDFPFRAGIDVTDVRQVKGLEFDYVVLVEVSADAYPVDDEARHLLHIGATRAAHQLWLTCTGKPSPLLPQWLQDRSY